MAESNIKRYVISEMYAEDSFPVDWTIFPDNFLNSISRNLHNVSAVNSEGEIIERTVVFLKPIKKFSGNVNTVELDNGSIIIGKENDIL